MRILTGKNLLTASNAPYGNRTRGERGFTMIEIAIALAVIAIALVAIIGVFPSGLNIKRDNRTDTLIFNDARFFMEAIKNGARGVMDLSQFVDAVNGRNAAGMTPEQIIGLLSRPNVPNVAIVRSLAGVPSEMTQETKDLAFRYMLISELREFQSGTQYSASLHTNLYELKLTFRWPVRGDGSVVTNSATTRTFRTLVSGRLIQTNVGGDTLWFFEN
jgi:prepilin-type N-terminal cleavage/methylation domain-containing protein